MRDRVGVIMIRSLIAAITLAVALPAGALAAGSPAAGTLTVRFVSVGQGDATIFEGPCGDTGVLDVPTGRAPDVLRALNDMGSGRRLAWLAVSHYDADHLGGVVALAETPDLKIGTVYDRGPQTGEPTKTYTSYVDWLRHTHKRHRALGIGDNFTLCQGAEAVTFHVVSVAVKGTAAGGVKIPAKDENDKGICLKITYVHFKMAACGDANGENGRRRRDIESVVAPKIGRVNLVKVDHHGSVHSSNATFVDTLKPSVAVISVGKNSYTHPSPGVVKRWAKVGTVFQTGTDKGQQRDGDVIATTNGKNSMRIRTTHSHVDKRFLLRTVKKNVREGGTMKTDLVATYVVLLICLGYGIAAWLVQMYRVVPPRNWLRQRIWSLQARIAAENWRVGQAGQDELKSVLGTIEGKLKPALFVPVSSVQSGWRNVHGIEDDHLLEVDAAVVDERLRTAAMYLASIPGDEAAGYVKRINDALTAQTQPTLDAKAALLQDAERFRHNVSDTNYENLANLLSKAVWLTWVALAIVVALAALFNRESFFLLGAAGALISRLTRVLRRRPSAADYGAEWSPLLLSPAGGALFGWIGVALVTALANDPFNVLSNTFAKPWHNAIAPLSLALAFAFGFSERLFDRLLGVVQKQVGSEFPQGQKK